MTNIPGAASEVKKLKRQLPPVSAPGRVISLSSTRHSPPVILPDDSFPALLKSALDALDSAAPKQELNLTAACGAVHITTDENGLPTALECPEHDLRVRFSDSEAL